MNADTGAKEVALSGKFVYKDIGVVLAFKQYIVFAAKISEDAHVALTTFKNVYEGNIYEVIIGYQGNTTTVIRFLSNILFILHRVSADSKSN